MNAGLVVGVAMLALALVGITMIGDLVSETIRGYLDLLPQLILRGATTRLDPARRQVYEDEWLPELLYVLRGAESRPITRLIRGIGFALGLFIATSKMRKAERRLQRLASASAWIITGFAVTLAARKRPAVRYEWPAHMTGEPGHELSARAKVAAAWGFVIAAVRYWLQGPADLAWIPVDAVLKSRLLSSLAVVLPTAMTVVILFRHGGIDEVLADAGSVLAIGGVLYGAIRGGRRWRGVKPSARPVDKE